MKTLVAVLLCSSLAFAGGPVDAPMPEQPVTLTPQQSHDEAVRVLTCEADLKDCAAEGKLEPKWLVIGVVAGVLSGLALGYGLAQLRR